MHADPFRWTTLAHAGREFLGPVDAATADTLLAAVAPCVPPGPEAPRVLDVGCGKGAWLLRAMARFAAHGTGVDPNPAFMADARAGAAAAGAADRLTLVTSTFEPLLVGRGFELAMCVGSLHAFGTLEDALRALATLVRPGGAAIVGAQYWQREPDPGYLAVFGGGAGEAAPLAATLAAPAAYGFDVLAHHASTPAQWDEYEEGYAARVRTWCAAHPDEPDAPLFSRRIEAWAAARERWGRDTMGFVTIAMSRA